MGKEVLLDARTMQLGNYKYITGTIHTSMNDVDNLFGVRARVVVVVGDGGGGDTNLIIYKIPVVRTVPVPV